MLRNRLQVNRAVPNCHAYQVQERDWQSLQRAALCETCYSFRPWTPTARPKRDMTVPGSSSDCRERLTVVPVWNDCHPSKMGRGKKF